jgi:ribosomal protein S18 acetylase RimI-like enzyme
VTLPDWTIVSASAVDERRLRAYLLKAWGDETVAAHGELLRPSEHPGCLALAEGGIVGHAAYRIDGDVGYLVAIDSRLPRLGIGSALLAAAEGETRQAGCRRMTLETTNDNLDALRFYQRRGYRIVAVRPGAVEEARRMLKPTIQGIGSYAIPMRDELCLEKPL